jgi:uncharacterized protein
VSDAWLRVEVAFAEPQRAIVKKLRMPAGSCAADAMRQAALDADFSAVDFEHSALGIFGRPIRPEQALKDGDRIEIYRPLAADPKIARRARVQQARKLRPG